MTSKAELWTIAEKAQMEVAELKATIKELKLENSRLKSAMIDAQMDIKFLNEEVEVKTKKLKNLRAKVDKAMDNLLVVR